MNELNQYFKYRCYSGLKKYNLQDKQEYINRLEYEIKTICEMNFCGYFLIVCELLQWAREQSIPTGPGRGSSAGSLVVFCLGITALDPIKYNLIFERFLDPSRIASGGLADIDLDFCEVRRYEVIQHLIDKYGAANVAHIGTYGSMKAKAAIRDITRTLGADYKVGDKLANLILPPIAGKTQNLKTCYKNVPELAVYRDYPEDIEGKILSWAEKFEDRIRSYGKHACFPAYSKLFTENGPISIGDLCGKTVNILTRRGYLPAYIHYTGEKQIFRLRYTSSKDSRKYSEIHLSQNHRILSTEWLPANKSLGKPVGYTSWYQKHNPISVLAGWLWNDGSWIEANKTQHIYFTPVKDDEAKSYFLKYLCDQRFSDRLDKYIVSRKYIKEIAMKFGTGFYLNLKDKEPPAFTTKKTDIIGWLCGFISANGTIQRGEIRIKICSLKLLEWIKSSLEEMGILTTKIYRRKSQITFIKGRKITNNGSWEIYISSNKSFLFLSLIGIIQTYKQEKIKPQIFTNFDYLEKLDSYDFSVLTNKEEDQNGYIDNLLVHNSGLIIADEPIYNYAPLALDKEGQPTTQFEMNNIEEVGLIKFDILGLRALTTINRCIDLIKETTGDIIDPSKVEVDDPLTYEILQQGDVDGIFQLEGSASLRDLVVRVKPVCLEDLSSIVAIFRPGPLGSDKLKEYLEIRAGRAKPKYLVPELEPILKETAGWIIFQESIMAIANKLAGYTLAETNDLRKAIGKKLPEKMAKHKAKFKAGISSKFGEKVADTLFSELENFGAYGFNKSHSISYAYIGYQMAYLKAHYPVEFMCACLTSDADEANKLIKYINYCRSKDIPVLPPDINKSKDRFTITPDRKGILFGLSAIKNIGVSAEVIIQERKMGGSFKNIVDFCNRIDLGKVNRKKLESLILAGAFDEFGLNKATLMEAVEDIYRYNKEQKSYENKKETYEKKVIAYNQRQLDIEQWDVLDKENKQKAKAEGFKKPGKVKVPVIPELPGEIKTDKLPEFGLDFILKNEKELLGCYVSGHPLDNIAYSTPWNIQLVKEVGEHQEKIQLMAVIATSKEITTKKTQQKMSYVVLEDKSATIDGVILPEVYQKYSELIANNVPSLYECQIDKTETDENKVIKLRVLNIISLIKFTKRPAPIDITLTIENALLVSKLLSKTEEPSSQSIHLYAVPKTQTTSAVFSLGNFWFRGNKDGLLNYIKGL